MSNKKNGANGDEEAADMLTVFQKPALSSLAISQKLVTETTKFWTRRMQAYAEQMAVLAQCKRPDQLMVAQAQFIERMKEDYVAEQEKIAGIFTAPPPENRPSA